MAVNYDTVHFPAQMRPLPSNMLLLLHCVLAHDLDNGADVQYKLVKNRRHGLQSIHESHGCDLKF